MVFGHNMKSMGSINQNPHETHSQKCDLGNLMKALALDSKEYSHFKNEKEDLGFWLFTATQKTHRNAHQEV